MKSEIVPQARLLEPLPQVPHGFIERRAGDADLAAGNIKSGVNLFGVTGTVVEGTTITNGLLKTGQTTSYGVGSDGNLQKGAAQSFKFNEDGTVTDNRTGLMWEMKSDDGSIHDKDNTYSWWDGMGTTFLAALNTSPCFAGHCDWRIPNNTELLSLVNYEALYPATFSVFNSGCFAGCTVLTCSCTVFDLGSGYWSSSTFIGTENNVAGIQGSAYRVDFSLGDVSAFQKGARFHVRAVRGGSHRRLDLAVERDDRGSRPEDRSSAPALQRPDGPPLQAAPHARLATGRHRSRGRKRAWRDRRKGRAGQRPGRPSRARGPCRASCGWGGRPTTTTVPTGD